MFEDINLGNKDRFEQIAYHKAAVTSLQNTNKDSIKFLSNKIFSMNSSLIDFKEVVVRSLERTDTTIYGTGSSATRVI